MDPWGGSVVLLFALTLAGFVSAPWLALYGIIGLLRRRVRASGERAVLRRVATLVWSAAVTVYTWGLLHLFQDESDAALVCQSAVGPKNAADVSGYAVSFFPLHFSCQVDGVGTFEGAVPGYVNPLMIILLLAAIGLTILTCFADQPATTSAAQATGSDDATVAR